MIKDKKYRTEILIICIAVPILTGTISALITGDMMKNYHFLNKPSLSPPGWVFPIVWTLLYILMGIASFRIVNSENIKNNKTGAMIVYGIQLAMNFIWPILFFKFSLYLAALVWIVLLWIVIVINIVWFGCINRGAGVLMTPYALWTAFAGYLNYAVYIMSLTPMILPR